VLDISGELPLFVSLVCGGRVLHTQLLAAPVASLRLPLDWNALRGVLAELRFGLVDATSGAALAATSIEVFNLNTSGGRDATTPLPFDADSGYVRDGLAPGICKLSVLVTGHESLEHEIVLAPGQVTDLGTIELGVPKSAKGRVVDGEGHPLKVSLRTFDAERARRPIPLRQFAYFSTEENGAFSVTAGHGVVDLLVADDRFAATCLEVDSAKAPIDDLRIVLVPGVPVCVRLLPEDLAREEFTIEDRDGHLVATRTLTMGSYRLNLRPGKYTATVRVNGEDVASDDFEVKDLPVEVALAR
jgi:hypothetical protein